MPQRLAKALTNYHLVEITPWVISTEADSANSSGSQPQAVGPLLATAGSVQPMHAEAESASPSPDTPQPSPIGGLTSGKCDRLSILSNLNIGIYTESIMVMYNHKRRSAAIASLLERHHGWTASRHNLLPGRYCRKMMEVAPSTTTPYRRRSSRSLCVCWTKMLRGRRRAWAKRQTVQRK